MVNSPAELAFPFVSAKPVTARFDGGDITSDAGMLLLAQADRKLGLSQAIADSIIDRRQQAKVQHPVLDLIRERLYAIAMGYEDANDLDTLADDPALRVSCGRTLCAKDRLGSQPTISRLENQVDSKDLLTAALAIAETTVGQLPAGTKRVVIDVDASEDPCHGQQELEFFNAYYGQHCYLPLYVHVSAEGDRQRLLASMLRPGRANSKTGLFGLLRRAIRLLRDRFADVEIVLRADGGFGQAEVLSFCEEQGLPFVLGLPTNQRIKRLAEPFEKRALELAAKEQSAEVERYYAEFDYQADTWDRNWRTVERIEVADGQVNARFVVTNLSHLTAEDVYDFYCMRGEQENRIKESKLDLKSGRTSCHRFLANQFRLLLHVAAYVLMSAVQDALTGTSLENAQPATVRLKLLKLGAQAKESVRRLWLHLSSSYPNRALFQLVYERLGVT